MLDLVKKKIIWTCDAKSERKPIHQSCISYTRAYHSQGITNDLHGHPWHHTSFMGPTKPGDELCIQLHRLENYIP